MKNISKKRQLVPIFLLFTIVFCIITRDVVACANGPNYWGNAYPGDFTTSTRYRHPREPGEYLFGSSAIPEAGGYDGSHYGTHDWIADAAIRSLRDITKNPVHYLDWTWLVNAKVVNNKWPVWKSYISATNHHEIIRSYITFLFATQMPDMRIKSGMSEDEKSYFPQKVDIPKESVVIQDFSNSMWVGQIQQHSFHFHVEHTSSGICVFSPYQTSPATKARELGKAAIKCIGNKIKDTQGNYKSAMQPEGAAGWLGAMTHYLADMIVPAHLLNQKTYSNVYSKGAYHSWFEKQLASLTKWDKAYGAKGGPETAYFSWDIAKIGMTGLIIPIRPDLAVTSMAFHAIEIAYRLDGNHQHIVNNGNNAEEAKNSGLYLNNSQDHWDWKEDLDMNGRDGSPHKYFYDKVEKLLCWATYFIACAMQYCLNEGKKELGNNTDLNPDYYVTNDPVPRHPPTPDPQRYLDEYLNTVSNSGLSDKFKKLLKSLGMIIAPIIITIANLLGRTSHLTGRLY